MNKTDFINKFVETLGGGITQKDANKYVNLFLDIIKEALESGDSVKLPGFGTFSTKVSAPRSVPNPQTGAIIHVPEKVRVKFSPGAGLAEAVAALNK